MALTPEQKAKAKRDAEDAKVLKGLFPPESYTKAPSTPFNDNVRKEQESGLSKTDAVTPPSQGLGEVVKNVMSILASQAKALTPPPTPPPTINQQVLDIKKAFVPPKQAPIATTLPMAAPSATGDVNVLKYLMDNQAVNDAMKQQTEAAGQDYSTNMGAMQKVLEWARRAGIPPVPGMSPTGMGMTAGLPGTGFDPASVLAPVGIPQMKSPDMVEATIKNMLGNKELMERMLANSNAIKGQYDVTNLQGQYNLANTKMVAEKVATPIKKDLTQTKLQVFDDKVGG